MQGGFSKYPASPSPNAQAVGAALLQRRGMGSGTMAPAPGSMAPAEPGYGPASMAPPAATEVTMPAMMRSEGAHKMSGGGQIDDNATQEGDGHSANAINVAVGEALTRVGSGAAGNNNPFKQRGRHMQNLRQLGLSDVEARLLVETGGV